MNPRGTPIRPLFVLGVTVAALLIAAYGWIEQRWMAAGFYLAILLLAALFVAPPVWSYSRMREIDETPERDEADEPDA